MKLLYTALAASVLLSVTPAYAGTVIQNNAALLAPADIPEVYGGNIQIKSGVHIVPVDNSAEQANFLLKVLHSDPTRYQNHWTKKAFREGLNPPRVDASDAEVVEFIKSTPGAVGYISGAAPPGVREVLSY